MVTGYSLLVPREPGHEGRPACARMEGPCFVLREAQAPLDLECRAPSAA